jgi:LmbE family N-acetylglucosaminyl deacetylase
MTRRLAALITATALIVTVFVAQPAAAVEVGSPVGSILVVAPHPDDDVITAAGITYNRADVTIAFMTNGDTDPGGEVVRQDEAVEAQRVLGQVFGSNEDNLVFLGYPDAHLLDVWNTPSGAWNGGSTDAGRGLGMTDWHDYRTGSIGQHADYNKAEMIADLAALIDARRPAHIFTTSDHDRHDDHSTTKLVVDAALAQVIDANPMYGSVVHETVVWHPDVDTSDNHWPQNRDPQNNILEDLVVDPTADPSFADVGLIWADREQFVVPTVMQNPNDAVNPKSQAIDKHQNQGGLGGFIGRWVHRDEIFWATYINYPELSISDATAVEGGDASFTISRTGAHNVAISVTATTSNGTATAPGDYAARSDVVNLAAGQASTTFVVNTTSDAAAEPTENFTVTLSNPSAETTIGDATGVGTINDNDSAGLLVDQLDGISLDESGGSDTYQVSLTTQPSAAVTVTLAPNAQVIADRTTLTFTTANWSTPQTITVVAVDDTLAEANPHAGSVAHTTTSADSLYDALPTVYATASIAENTRISGPTTAATGSPAEFTADTGADSYAWTVTSNGSQVAAATTPTLGFTPAAGGDYTVELVTTVGGVPAPSVSQGLKVLGDIATSTFRDDIVWLADAGITAGCNPPANDEFCPNKNVTRGQMAAFLVRFLGLTDDGGGNTFTDDDGSVFEDDIAKLATAGVTTGCNADGTNFCPNKSVTRGQMAAFLRRAAALDG